MQYASHCTDAPLAYHLAGGLAVLTQTTPIDYHWVFDSEMHSPIYTLCIGASSNNRKSASVKLARKLLDLALPGAVGEQPGSKEILVDQLRAQPRQLIVYPEFGTFLSQAERGYLNPLKTTYTEAWDCTPLGRSLVKKKDTEAKTPRLSILAASTLEYMERHTEPADWTGGFMARYITFYADRERDFDVPPGWPGRQEQLAEGVKYLEAGGHLGAPRGPCLGFDPAALKMWKDWYKRLEEFSRQSTATTAGAIARSSSHAIRVALLLAWDYGDARSGQPWYITREVLEPALLIINLHLRSVLRVGQSLASTKDMKDRRDVLNAIPLNLGADGIARPLPVSLGQVCRSANLLLRRAREIIETLQEEGAVQQYLGPEVRGAWYIRMTEEESAAHGRNVTSAQPIAPVPVEAPAAPPANVIPIGPYLVQSSLATGGPNTTGAPSTVQEADWVVSLGPFD